MLYVLGFSLRFKLLMVNGCLGGSRGDAEDAKRGIYWD